MHLAYMKCSPKYDNQNEIKPGNYTPGKKATVGRGDSGGETR